MIRVGIVEDHEAMILGTTMVLSGEPDMRVVGAAKTARGLVQRRRDIDVILLDLVLGDGATPAQNMRTLAPLGAQVVAYTVGDRPQLLRDAVRAGVVGVIRKSDRAAAIIEGIRSSAA